MNIRYEWCSSMLDPISCVSVIIYNQDGARCHVEHMIPPLACVYSFFSLLLE